MIVTLFIDEVLVNLLEKQHCWLHLALDAALYNITPASFFADLLIIKNGPSISLIASPKE
jgi:hypothetical protein